MNTVLEFLQKQGKAADWSVEDQKALHPLVTELISRDDLQGVPRPILTEVARHTIMALRKQIPPEIRDQGVDVFNCKWHVCVACRTVLPVRVLTAGWGGVFEAPLCKGCKNEALAVKDSPFEQTRSLSASEKVLQELAEKCKDEEGGLVGVQQRAEAELLAQRRREDAVRLLRYNNQGRSLTEQESPLTEPESHVINDILGPQLVPSGDALDSNSSSS